MVPVESGFVILVLSDPVLRIRPFPIRRPRRIARLVARRVAALDVSLVMLPILFPFAIARVGI
jgi:hypothetical protein